MSEINSSNQSLTNILDKLGINSAKEKFAPKETKDQLRSRRFFKINDYSTSKSRSICSC